MTPPAGERRPHRSASGPEQAAATARDAPAVPAARDAPAAERDPAAAAPSAVPRTAVIVIAGVGDRPRDSAAADLAAGLLHHGGAVFSSATETVETYAASHAWFREQPDRSQQLTRHTLLDARGRPVADVVEAWWADLSRFPGATRSAFLAAAGMLFQATTIGRAALGGGGVFGSPPSGGPGGATSAAPAHPASRYALSVRLLAAIEWIVAVPITLMVAITVALFAIGSYTLATSGARSPAALVGLSVIVAVTLALLLGPLRSWYARQRPYVDATGIALVFFTLALAVSGTVVEGGYADRGIADAILLITVYPFRIAWMLVAALCLVAVVATLRRRLRAPAALESWQRIGTAAASTLGPFGLAFLGALVYAAVGVAIQGLAGQSRFEGSNPLCLGQMNAWIPAQCGAGVDNAFKWGLLLFQQGVIPLLYVTCIVVATLLLTVLWLVPGVVSAGADEARRGRVVLLVERLVATAPLAIGVAVIPAAAAVILAWLPLGDHVLAWQSGGGRALGPHSTLGTSSAAFTAISAYVIAGLLLVARTLRLGLPTLFNAGAIADSLRLPVDLAYDIATYLRDRAPAGGVAPRYRIFGRIASLLEHLERTGAYDRALIVAHSQGTVLATTLLADPARQLRLPASGGDVALVTMGTPLRHLYDERFPQQFSWVSGLGADPDAFVTRVTSTWVNFGADGDLVGRTLFQAEHEAAYPTGRIPAAGPVTPGAIDHCDWGTGRGGHGSYWDSDEVYRVLVHLLTRPGRFRLPR